MAARTSWPGETRTHSHAMPPHIHHTHTRRPLTRAAATSISAAKWPGRGWRTRTRSCACIWTLAPAPGTSASLCARCITLRNATWSRSQVHLPTGYHFGLSAATGDLADNHDIVALKLQDPMPMTADEREQLSQRIQEVQARHTLPRSLPAGCEGHVHRLRRRPPVPGRPFHAASPPSHAAQDAPSGFSAVKLAVVLCFLIVLAGVALALFSNKRGSRSALPM